MSLAEINFDGIVGPSHNYAGLSLGNLAGDCARRRRLLSRARLLCRASRRCAAICTSGWRRASSCRCPGPISDSCRSIAADDTTPTARLLAAAWSASSMWTANAATVSPAPDTADGRCHLTAANLVTMPHRVQEWPDTARQLQLAFADQAHFASTRRCCHCFGDEGAANHMRMCTAHEAPGVEIFVYGRPGGRFPARQHEQASRIVARQHGLDPERVLFVEQNPEAIAAGAFHNDVVAVANEQVLFTHELAFADQQGTYDAIRAKMPEAEIVDVAGQRGKSGGGDPNLSVQRPASDPALWRDGADHSYGGMGEPCVWAWLDTMLAGNGPIRQVVPVDVKQSMANGGGPACLRLRVVADPATIDPRFLLDDATTDVLTGVIQSSWPEQIDLADLGSETLERTVLAARGALLQALDLQELT